MTPRKHADVIKAWADGAEVEYRAPAWGLDTWVHTSNPEFAEDVEYRVALRADPYKHIRSALQQGRRIQMFEDGSWTRPGDYRHERLDNPVEWYRVVDTDETTLVICGPNGVAKEVTLVIDSYDGEIQDVFVVGYR